MLLSENPKYGALGDPVDPGGSVPYRTVGTKVPDTIIPAAKASLENTASSDNEHAPAVSVVLVSAPSQVVVVEHEVCNQH